MSKALETLQGESRIADRVVSAAIYGYVYVVQMEGCPWLKIGRTDQSDGEAVRRRVQSMQTGCPLSLQIVKEYPCENPAILESSLHRLLAKSRKQGEWFETTIEQIERLMATARYDPTVWREAVEKAREARRACTEAARVRSVEAFEMERANYEAARARRLQEDEASLVCEDAGRAQKVQSDMRAFAKARKVRRREQRVRSIGVLCCGIVIGVAVTLLMTMP